MDIHAFFNLPAFQSDTLGLQDCLADSNSDLPLLREQILGDRMPMWADEDRNRMRDNSEALVARVGCHLDPGLSYHRRIKIKLDALRKENGIRAGPQVVPTMQQIFKQVLPASELPRYAGDTTVYSSKSKKFNSKKEKSSIQKRNEKRHSIQLFTAQVFQTP
jgi:hypothetical protein